MKKNFRTFFSQKPKKKCENRQMRSLSTKKSAFFVLTGVQTVYIWNAAAAGALCWPHGSLRECVEGVVLVAADVVEIARANEYFDDSLSGGAGETGEALDVGTTHEGVGLEVVGDEGLDFVERDIGGVGLFGRTFEAELLAVAYEGLLGSEHDALGRNAGCTYLCGIVNGRSGEGEGEGTEAFEAHAVAVGEVFADNLLDGGDGGVNIGSIEGASCGHSLNDLLEGDGTFGHYSGVIYFRSFGIGVGVGIKFERYCHNYDVLCSAASLRACVFFINNII